MHAMVTNNGYYSSFTSQSQNCVALGRLSLTQLGELRHRGAFSTVSITLASCCTACSRSADPEVKKKPQEWYQDALACLAKNASALTRRSAGLPAMVTGVLGALPGGTFFDDVVLDLQAIADRPLDKDQDMEDARLPQVHALNCLKDMFTDARFGSRTDRHVADTLEIAASSLESQMCVTTTYVLPYGIDMHLDGPSGTVVSCYSKH